LFEHELWENKNGWRRGIDPHFRLVKRDSEDINTGVRRGGDGERMLPLIDHGFRVYLPVMSSSAAKTMPE
jgi:hypothetical protein